MDRLHLDEVDDISAPLEDLVDRTPGADRWCSGPDWVLPAHRAFAPGAEPLVLAGERTVALLARYETADGIPLVAGLEPLWGFACPLLGADPGASARRLVRALAPDPDWQAVVLGGMPHDSGVLRAVAAELSALGPVRLAEGIVRQVADLDGDVAAYWARRGSRHRRNVRRARRQAADEGLEITDASDQPDLHERVVRIERRSWKGRAGEGLASPQMAEFYRLQLGRLRRHGRVRASVARRDGVDVGFIIGGRRGSTYRGLQLSYAEEVRHLSVGHLLQACELERLAAEGVRTYDLGMDLEYKRGWADRAVVTHTLVVRRGSEPGGPLR